MIDQPKSFTPMALNERAAEPADVLVHMALFVAMALVAAATAMIAFKVLDLTPGGAVGAGLAVLAASLGAHLLVSARAAPQGTPRMARPRVARPAPLPPVEPQIAGAAAQAEAPSAEPSELALDLLRRASEPAAPAPAPVFAPEPPSLSSLPPRVLWDEPAAAAPPPPPVAQETEFERVERLVKRLAEEVNAREHAPMAAPNLPPPLPAPTPSMATATEVAARDPNATQLAFDLSSAIASLPKWPEPVAEPKIDALAFERREAILSALHAQRIDVFLEPILGLNDQRPQHFEVSIGLRGAHGETLNLAEAASGLSGTGLLPLIDSARIAKAAQMARRLAERGKAGAVLTEFSAESLGDRDTQADLTGRPSAGAFPGQLVLMLPQAQVRLFSAADWQTLARLTAAGFGFALTDVTSLDMDFAALAAGGFRFARLDAETFLVGLPTSHGMVEPTGICRHIAQCGLSLIVGGIADDMQLAKIFGFGVLFGQGQLFGGARLVDAPAPRHEGPVASAAE